LGERTAERTALEAIFGTEEEADAHGETVFAFARDYNQSDQMLRRHESKSVDYVAM
jgi:hypothetical protein